MRACVLRETEASNAEEERGQERVECETDGLRTKMEGEEGREREGGGERERKRKRDGYRNDASPKYPLHRYTSPLDARARARTAS